MDHLFSFVLPMDIHSKSYWWITFLHSSYRSTCVYILPMDHPYSSYQWIYIQILPMCHLHSFYRWTCIQNCTDGSFFFIQLIDGHAFCILQMDHRHLSYHKRCYHLPVILSLLISFLFVFREHSRGCILNWATCADYFKKDAI